MRIEDSRLIFSPSDLITYMASPFASWMDRYYLERPDGVMPDELSEDQALIIQTGHLHELNVKTEFAAAGFTITDLSLFGPDEALEKTKAAVAAKEPIIYQAALRADNFAGLADFVILEGDKYHIWDTKLARSPKPYYAIQLCCYSEMFAVTIGCELPETFGIILGSKERIKFRVEDFVHYYQRLKESFLFMHSTFTGNLADRPEPHPRADHGRWTSHADAFLDESDHLVRVAGISIGQIKKLKAAGICTLAELAGLNGQGVKKLAADTLAKLVAQAKLQHLTRSNRKTDPDAPAQFQILPQLDPHKPTGLAALPPEHTADIFFDMEGYPLFDGGLEYLFGASTIHNPPVELRFDDWWGHDRSQERKAFEGFVDWAYARWRANPEMHIYHYASYEVSALRRLSTLHDTRQEEVDDLLRNEVFVDLYQIVRHGLMIGEESYSIKSVERFYRPKRGTEVATGTDSIVQYARWIGSGEPSDWNASPILKAIRDYNKDDCDSTAELTFWLRKLARENGIARSNGNKAGLNGHEQKEPTPEAVERLEIATMLRAKGDDVSVVLADLVDFHRREQKPVFWKMFDRASSTPEELRDDNGCIAEIVAVGGPEAEKRSLLQSYAFDPNQECKLKAGDTVMFTHRVFTDLNLFELDRAEGTLKLKATQRTLDEKFDGAFPRSGSLILSENVRIETLQRAITSVAKRQLEGNLPGCAGSLLQRKAPAELLQKPDENTIDAAVRITSVMNGGCLVIQGPPGTGKTYTASQIIKSLLAANKKVGVTSNSHKAIVNLLEACGDVMRESGGSLQGVKVGGEGEGSLFRNNPNFRFAKDGSEAAGMYSEGVIGGTAWVFTRPEWEGVLDFLFVDEAGQVSLANAVAMSRCAKNLVLLGDQMQLEQPIQGSHPGDAGLSALQYALKDCQLSKTDAPVFRSVVPADYGLFLGESRRMHPNVCRFISESIYENRLTAYADCSRQRMEVPNAAAGFISAECGVVFSDVEHEGNIQQSDEEVERVVAIYQELLGRNYTATDGSTRPLALEDFLFIAPYNAQVRSLEAALPEGSRVGSVDRFQGQEAPVCILSLCSSCGEYGSRGLGFILDRNRINVAISRAQCLAVVVADSRISTAAANSLNEMRLLNLFCKLVAS